MKTVTMYIQDDCQLCHNAREVFAAVQKDFPIQLNEHLLTEDHPRYKEYLVALPVVVDDTRELLSPFTEEKLRETLGVAFHPTPLFYVGKFFEAMGFITVFIGFVYGLLGNMWIDLYFFLAGILLFGAGRIVEKREARLHKQRVVASFALPITNPS